MRSPYFPKQRLNGVRREIPEVARSYEQALGFDEGSLGNIEKTRVVLPSLSLLTLRDIRRNGNGRSP